MSHDHSNFEVCRQINALAGNTLQHNLETAKHQFKIISGEFNEMTDHINEGDLEKLRDDIADVLFTTYGLAARLGFPADEDFREVCRSNMTKFDLTIEDRVRTAAKYLEKGIETYSVSRQLSPSEPVYYITYSAKDQIGLDGKSYPKGKWLKSVNFQEPLFVELGVAALAQEAPLNLRQREYTLIEHLIDDPVFTDQARLSHGFFLMGLYPGYGQYEVLASVEILEQIFETDLDSFDVERFTKLVVIDRQGDVVLSLSTKFRSLFD